MASNTPSITWDGQHSCAVTNNRLKSCTESLALSRQLGDKLVAAEALDGLACSASGDAERVARLFGAAEALREAVGYRQEPREHALREPYLAAVRPRLTEARWDAVWAEGRQLGFEEAIAYALEKPRTSDGL